MNLTRLATRYNFREVESEWRWEWIFYVLSSLGVPDEILQDCLPEDGSFKDINVNHKINLRKHLTLFDITIVDNYDGEIRIYVYNEEQHILVAQWNKCSFTYKEDLKEIDPSKKIYIEIRTETWAIFEEEILNE